MSATDPFKKVKPTGSPRLITAVFVATNLAERESPSGLPVRKLAGEGDSISILLLSQATS